MPSIIYDDFRGGLDRRPSKQSYGPANILYVLNNAYITTGRKIRKRPCLTHVATLEPGTKGLKGAGGYLNTFYESGTITHSNPLFKANKAPHPTVSQSVAIAHFGEMFNGYLYASLEYQDGSVWHQYFDGTSPPRVTAANCPQSKIVKKMGQKIYADNGASVRMCKTADPRDWSAVNDAGTLAVGIYAAGSDTVTALGEYIGKMVVAFSDSMQTWTTDADPAKHALQSTAPIGTEFAKCTAPFSGDLVLLAKAGFRSVSLIQQTSNLQESDVGSAIDKFRSDIASSDHPMTLFYPKLGQLWTINGDTVYVFSLSRTQKLSAWSIFTLPVTADDATIFNSELYIRSGDVVYRVDDTATSDHGQIPLVEVEMYFQDQKSSGILKQFYGFDLSTVGTCDIAWRFNPNNTSEITAAVSAGGDSRPDELRPMELCAVAIAPRITHQADEAFELDFIQAYYEQLGPV